MFHKSIFSRYCWWLSVILSAPRCVCLLGRGLHLEGHLEGPPPLQHLGLWGSHCGCGSPARTTSQHHQVLSSCFIIIQPNTFIYKVSVQLIPPYSCYWSPPGSPLMKASAGSPTTSPSSPSSLWAWRLSQAPRPWMWVCGASDRRRTTSPCGWRSQLTSRASLRDSVSGDGLIPLYCCCCRHAAIWWCHRAVVWIQSFGAFWDSHSSFFLMSVKFCWSSQYISTNYFLLQGLPPCMHNLSFEGISCLIFDEFIYKHIFSSFFQ